MPERIHGSCSLVWFLTLHIITLIFWCASLLYLPELIAGVHSRKTAISEPEHRYGSVARLYIYSKLLLLPLRGWGSLFVAARLQIRLKAGR